MYAKYFIMLLLGLSLQLSAQETPQNHRYDIESGMVISVKKTLASGMEILTYDTLYFKNWGWTEAHFSTTRTKNPFTNQVTEEYAWSLMDGPYLTKVDMHKMAGKKTRSDLLGSFGQMTQSQQQQFGNNLIEGMEADQTTLPVEEVAGKPCAVTKTELDFAGLKQVSTLWQWNKITLKAHSNAMGSEVTEEASLVKTGFEIPEKYFAPPPGATIEDLSNQSLPYSPNH